MTKYFWASLFSQRMTSVCAVQMNHGGGPYSYHSGPQMPHDFFQQSQQQGYSMDDIHYPDIGQNGRQQRQDNPFQSTYPQQGQHAGFAGFGGQYQQQQQQQPPPGYAASGDIPREQQYSGAQMPGGAAPAHNVHQPQAPPGSSQSAHPQDGLPPLFQRSIPSIIKKREVVQF